MNENIYFHEIGSGAIDEKNGVVKGVSLITLGSAKGHNLTVDAMTMNQLEKSLGAAKPPGVKAKLNHRTGVEAIFGHVNNIRMDGNKLKGDLNLLKEHKDYGQTMELIKTMPSQVGLSVAFQGEKEEGADGTIYARCKNIVSVDLVTDPAANPDGMFSAKVDNISLDMDENTEPNEPRDDLNARLEAIEGFQSDLAEAIEEAAELDQLDSLESGEQESDEEEEEYDDGYAEEGEQEEALAEAEKAEFSTIDDVLTYFENKAEGALEAEKQIREQHQFEQVDGKVDNLIEFAEHLEEENKLLREALEENGVEPIQPGKGELFGFEAEEGTFQFAVQSGEKNTKSEKIMDAITTDPRGHRNWLVEQGVFSN